MVFMFILMRYSIKPPNAKRKKLIYQTITQHNSLDTTSADRKSVLKDLLSTGVTPQELSLISASKYIGKRKIICKLIFYSSQALLILYALFTYTNTGIISPKISLLILLYFNLSLLVFKLYYLPVEFSKNYRSIQIETIRKKLLNHLFLSQILLFLLYIILDLSGSFFIEILNLLSSPTFTPYIILFLIAVNLLLIHHMVHFYRNFRRIWMNQLRAYLNHLKEYNTLYELYFRKTIMEDEDWANGNEEFVEKLKSVSRWNFS